MRSVNLNHFFLPPSAFTGESVLFPKDISTQISRVLRLKPGGKVITLDDTGHLFEVELESVTSKMVTGRILRSSAAGNEPEHHLTLQICLTQREKFEWILQKGTELGVVEFMPVLTSRTLVHSLDEISNKFDRWKRILKEAAEQCERGRIPALLPPDQLKNALTAEAGALSLVLNEQEHQLSLKQALEKKPDPTRIFLLVGPEGGFSEDEISVIKKAGYQSVTLGPRILRMETAAIAAASIIMYEMGEMS
jgi:16S rRNA (uracil1498-N3)-methyltransferase